MVTLLPLNSTSLPFLLIGKQIKDLESITAADFATEAKAWTAPKLVETDVTVSESNGKAWLGGYNILGTATTAAGSYFQRNYKTLPHHNVIFFSAVFSVLDGWELGVDGIKIVFDGNQLERLEFSQSDIQCNNNEVTEVYVVGRIPHYFNTLTLRIVSDSKKPSSQASFGLRDVNILFANVDAEELYTDACVLSSGPLDRNQCLCPKGTFAFFNDEFSIKSTPYVMECTECHKNCATCYGPSDKECYECARGTFFDGTSCVECHSSCETCTGPGPSKCTQRTYESIHPDALDM